MATVKHIIDTRTKTKNGKHPIKIYVYHAGEERKFKTKLFASPDQYKNLAVSKKHNDKKLLDELTELINNTKLLCKEMEDAFQWFMFKQEYDKKVLKNEIKLPPKFRIGHRVYTKIEDDDRPLTVDELYRSKIERFDYNEQMYSKMNYENSLIALNKFKNSKMKYKDRDLLLEDIDKEFLDDWKIFIMKGKDGKPNSITTAKTYMRPLRSIFSDAVDKKYISHGLYPFGKGGYKIGNNKSANAALHIDDLKKLIDYVPVNDDERQALDYWTFSLLGKGIAPIDIALLTKANIKLIGGVKTIVFKRHKNILKDKSEDIDVPIKINEKVQCILDRVGAKKGKFLFPILTTGLKVDWKDYLNFLDLMGERLGRIGKKLKLEKPLFLYASRHVVASQLSKDGFNEISIANLMGNTTSAMARNYIGLLDNETMIKADNILDKLVA